MYANFSSIFTTLLRHRRLVISVLIREKTTKKEMYSRIFVSLMVLGVVVYGQGEDEELREEALRLLRDMNRYQLKVAGNATNPVPIEYSPLTLLVIQNMILAKIDYQLENFVKRTPKLEALQKLLQSLQSSSHRELNITSHVIYDSETLNGQTYEEYLNAMKKYLRSETTDSTFQQFESETTLTNINKWLQEKSFKHWPHFGRSITSGRRSYELSMMNFNALWNTPKKLVCNPIKCNFTKDSRWRVTNGSYMTVEATESITYLSNSAKNYEAIRIPLYDDESFQAIVLKPYASLSILDNFTTEDYKSLYDGLFDAKPVKVRYSIPYLKLSTFLFNEKGININSQSSYDKPTCDSNLHRYKSNEQDVAIELNITTPFYFSVLHQQTKIVVFSALIRDKYYSMFDISEPEQFKNDEDIKTYCELAQK